MCIFLVMGDLAVAETPESVADAANTEQPTEDAYSSESDLLQQDADESIQTISENQEVYTAPEDATNGSELVENEAELNATEEVQTQEMGAGQNPGSSLGAENETEQVVSDDVSDTTPDATASAVVMTTEESEPKNVTETANPSMEESTTVVESVPNDSQVQDAVPAAEAALEESESENVTETANSPLEEGKTANESIPTDSQGQDETVQPKEEGDVSVSDFSEKGLDQERAKEEMEKSASETDEIVFEEQNKEETEGDLEKEIVEETIQKPTESDKPASELLEDEVQSEAEEITSINEVTSEQSTPLEAADVEQQSENMKADEDTEAVPSDVASASVYIEAPETSRKDILAENAADVLPLSDYATENSTRGFVYRLYRTVLQREPDEKGFQYWVGLLEDGTFTAAMAVEGFFNSKEYQTSGRSNAQIVTDCYNTLLNRGADAKGFEYWKDRLDIGMTSQSILQGFVQSSEFTKLAEQYGLERGSLTVTNPLDRNYDRTYFVYRMYKNCLGREPDRAGEEFWVSNLENGMTGAEVASGFFFSNEFNNRRYDNNEFVEILYQTILGRGYDAKGLADWTGKLNYTQTREKVLNGFIGSIEFGKQCEKAEISAGDPIATPDDTIEWQNNITVLQLCNNYRRTSGIGDLHTREDLLWDLAMLRAEEITEQFAHTRPNGTSCFTLFTKQGFYGFLGENLAGGQTSAEEVVDAWINSPSHRENILNKNYTYLATGYNYDPGASTYCADGKYKGQYVTFNTYWAQSFCNYGININ